MRRNPKNLNTQLDAYAVAVKPLAGSGGRIGNWSIYAVATGSALAMATAANAQIISSAGTPITVSIPHFSGLPSNSTNFNSIHITDGGRLGGKLDLKFGVVNSRSTGGGTSGSGSGSGNGSARRGRVAPPGRGQAAAVLFSGLNSLGLLTIGGSSSLKKLALGATISGSGPFKNGFAGLRGKGTQNGQTTGTVGKWSSGTGFAGIKLLNGDLGWLKLGWTGNNGFPDTITYYGWAVQTDGGSIHAGDTGVGTGTPEPGTFALALLAAGAAGVLAWRRRKQPVAE